ncbi:YncE family protein [Lolliginicoccus levis]|uniref:YncE family protein n=1 Tax=Lolliginicoccus levis TaxID=2919542 RepID=UPI00241DD1DC|nr:hypothetical protein [Lolliginicoccus levis]
MAVTPDGAAVYVTNADDDTVSVIDTATNTVTGAPVPVGGAPLGVAITPDGSRAYIANKDSANVSVIDTATNMVIDSITVGAGPRGVALTPDGSTVYVTNAFDDTVSVIAVEVAPTITGTPPAGAVGEPFVFSFTVTGQPAPTVTTVDPLPAGITLAPDGTLTGTPTESGSFPITVTTSNGVAPDATANVTLAIAPAECTGSLCLSAGSSGS